MSVLEILPPSCHKVCYFIKTKSRDEETANMAAESQSHQMIHEENEIEEKMQKKASPFFSMMC